MHTGVSINDGGRYFEKASRPAWFDPKRPSALALQSPDPAFADTDIGRNSFMMHKVRRAWTVRHLASPSFHPHARARRLDCTEQGPAGLRARPPGARQCTPGAVRGGQVSV